MASYNRVTASGSTDTFSVPFPYLDKSHVQVKQNGVLISSSAYTWPTTSTVKFNAGNVAAGVVVDLRRVTPKTPTVVFSIGNLKALNLNNAVKQALYIAEEGWDWGVDLMSRGWTTSGYGTGGTITKQAAGAVPKFDANGNLTSFVDGALIDAIPSYVAIAQAAALAAGSAAGTLIPHLYNVKAFGALGNNIADDTASINAARAAAIAAGVAAGRPGMVVLPPGLYKTTGIVMDTAGEQLIGMGGWLVAASSSVTPLKVSASFCVVDGINITTALFPDAGTALLEQTAGADCAFRKCYLVGGYYGFKGTGGGDTYVEDMKVFGCYSDYAFTQNYEGFWGYQCKFDGIWPVQTPVAANEKGIRATTTAYVVGDVVSENGWLYQCSAAGTSGVGTLTPTLSAVAIVDGAGTLRWKTYRTSAAAGFHVDSGSLFFSFVNCDFTGGHVYGVYMTNSLATLPPSTMFFSSLCEFGAPLTAGLQVIAGTHINLEGVILDFGISATAIGAILGAVTHCRIRGCTIAGMFEGVEVSAGATGVVINDNTIVDCSSRGVRVLPNAGHFSVSDNYMGLSATWGNNNVAITVEAGTSDYYNITNNIVHGSSSGVVDGGTGIHKTVSGNV
jgi:hypothetical protein